MLHQQLFFNFMAKFVNIT